MLHFTRGMLSVWGATCMSCPKEGEGTRGEDGCTDRTKKVGFAQLKAPSATCEDSRAGVSSASLLSCCCRERYKLAPSFFSMHMGVDARVFEAQPSMVDCHHVILEDWSRWVRRLGNVCMHERVEGMQDCVTRFNGCI